MSFDLSPLAVATAGGSGGGAGFDILTDLAVILCVAALTTLLFQRIRQPVVLGYLLAGLIVGPHVPVPLFADSGMAHMLSELGVILLMFSLGLEFSLRKLVRIGPTSGIVALIECSLMISLGYGVGRLLGFTPYESIFTGALVAISSTTIIVKAFAEQKIKGKLAEIVFGVLIAEDLIAVLMLAVLTAVASGAGLSQMALFKTIGRLLGFLALGLAGGMLIVPRLVRLVVKFGRKETTVIASVGICFGFALLARKAGYSVALGAFLGGALVAESGASKTIEELIEPIRDVFAAVFFVSVGMLIDPVLIVENWAAVLALTAVVVVGKIGGVTLGAFIAGNGVRSSVQAGMSLAQIGEFSFIIASLGASLGVIGKFLYPVAVAVSALTTLATPWLIRLSGPAASYLDRRLPHALQTYATLYGSWVGQMRSARQQHQTAWTRIRRLTGLLGLDVLLMAAIVIGAALSMHRLEALAAQAIGLEPGVARVLVIGATGALLVPFLFGAVRTARALGLALAVEALPSAQGLDLAAAPRRALLVTLQLAILLVAGIPLVALTQPFLSATPAIVVLLVGLAALAIPFWRSATNLQGHVRAGAQVLLEALSSQSQGVDSRPHTDVRRLVPGLGEAGTLKLGPGDAWVGRTLRDLNLRGLTGATVIGIERGTADVPYPSASEVLRAGDTLVLIGTREAVTAAKELSRTAGSVVPDPASAREAGDAPAGG